MTNSQQLTEAINKAAAAQQEFENCAKNGTTDHRTVEKLTLALQKANNEVNDLIGAAIL